MSAARNTGLDAAKGDYIWFVDADDFVQENCLAEIKALIEKEQCDRVTFEFYEFYNELPEAIKKHKENGEEIPGARVADVSVWDSVFSRKLIEQNKLRFSENLCFAEDTVFKMKYRDIGEKREYIYKALYFYRRNDTSVTVRRDAEKIRKFIVSSIEALKQMIELYCECGRNREDKKGSINFAFKATLYEISALPYKTALPYITAMNTLLPLPFKEKLEKNRLLPSFARLAYNNMCLLMCRLSKCRCGFALLKLFVKGRNKIINCIEKQKSKAS